VSAVTKNWVHDARTVIHQSPVDFFAVDAKKYWLDMVVCTVCAYTAAGVSLQADSWWIKAITFPLAAFWLYRANSMVHEVSHLTQSQLNSFKVGWNLLLGVPTLFPSTFFTSHHRDHHSGRYYGTEQDPEYIINVFTPGSVLSSVFYALHVLIYPLWVLLRFMFAPVSYLKPEWREFTLRRLSSFTLNWKYERNTSRVDRKNFAIIELLCCVRAWAIPITIAMGINHWTRVPQMYLLAIAILFMNQMRFFADHHFESHGKQMTMANHVMDSCNYSKSDWLTWLFFPFTIRFHALHHLFPTIPYHHLPAAHEHLSRNLPSDSAYHDLDRPGWWHTARENFGFLKRPLETAAPGQHKKAS